jgi:heptosyltransferase-2
LKKQVKGAEVHYVTKKAFQPVLENNPYIDKLWLFEGDLKGLARQLSEESIDYIIDLHNNLRSHRLRRTLRIISFPFHKINLEKWLMVNFKINRLPDKHIVDRYMETTRLFEVANDGEGLDYFLSEKDMHLPGEVKEKLPEMYVSIAIGAQHFTKKAPPVKLAEICDRIKAPVLLLGGPEDRAASGEILKLTKNGSVIDLCGRLSLNQSAYLVKNSKVVISHDTGLMHIAAAFGKKIISIWGNTIPEFGMAPYLPDPDSKIFEIKTLSCRPCSKIGFDKCPKKHFKCMKEHNADEIAKAVNLLL